MLQASSAGCQFNETKTLTYDFNLPRRLEKKAGNFGVLSTARYRFAIVFGGWDEVESRFRDVRQSLIL